MLNAFLRFIRNESLFSPDQPILLAVSGGIDSVVMTALFHQAGFLFGIAHCNFTLRGEESDREERFVEQLAGGYKVPFYSRSFATENYAREHHLSVQMAARELRYRWFDELLDSQNFDLIATAHHLDDQVETILINLTRGTGLDGLQGIRSRQGRVVRPLMFATRTRIEQFQQDHNLPFCIDSSNLSAKYVRNKIRHEVLPVLDSINPDFRNGLSLTVERLKEAGLIVREQVRAKREMVCREDPDGLTIHIPRLLQLTAVNTYLNEWLSPMGFNYQTIKRISESLTGIPGKIFLSQTFCLIRDRDNLIVRPIGTVTPPTVSEYDIDADVTRIEQPVALSFEKIGLSGYFTPDKNPRIAFLDLEMIRFPLILRRWKKGDSFQPFGMKHTKKLSDFFIDEKFSVLEKENVWILESDGKIAWLVGHRPDDRFRITDKTAQALRVEWLDCPSSRQ